jgi:hypothetical protein
MIKQLEQGKNSDIGMQYNPDFSLQLSWNKREQFAVHIYVSALLNYYLHMTKVTNRNWQ